MRVVFREVDPVTGELVHEPVATFAASEVSMLVGLTSRGDDVSGLVSVAEVSGFGAGMKFPERTMCVF